MTCGKSPAIISANHTIDGVTKTYQYCLRCFAEAGAVLNSGTSVEQIMEILGKVHPSPFHPDPLPPLETSLERIKEASKTIPSQEKLPDSASALPIPPEITRIRSGAICHFVGAFINDGLDSFYAFDSDRHLAIAILGTADSRKEKVPDQENLDSHQCVRYLDRGKHRWAQFVTIVEVTPEEVQEFAIIANALLPAGQASPPFHGRTDTAASTFELLSKGQKRYLPPNEDNGQLGIFISQLLKRSIERAQGKELLRRICALAMDAAGTLYATCNDHTILKLKSSGEGIVLAGKRDRRGLREGIGSDARFEFPQGIVVDRKNNIYVTDAGNGVIRVMTPEGDVSTYAGTLNAKESVDGPRKTAAFKKIGKLTLDKEDSLYVSDSYTIRRITPDGMVSTLAVTPNETHVTSLRGEMAVDSEGSLYVASGRISKISRDEKITTLTWKRPDGTEESELKYYSYMAIDSSDNIYIFQFFAILKISQDGQISTVAGVVCENLRSEGKEKKGYVDGKGSEARFGDIGGMVIDRYDNIYVADNGCSAIRKVTPDGTVTTVIKFGEKDLPAE
jgi:sugar lactone lactonase YvrE